MATEEAEDETEVTPAMIEAGEETILEVVGGADLGGSFSAGDLARKVFLAMTRVRLAWPPMRPP